MTVSDADGDDSGEEVEISSSFVVPQPLHVSFMKQQRLLVVSQQGLYQVLAPYRAHVLVRRSLQINRYNQKTAREAQTH